MYSVLPFIHATGYLHVRVQYRLGMQFEAKSLSMQLDDQILEASFVEFFVPDPSRKHSDDTVTQHLSVLLGAATHGVNFKLLSSRDREAKPS
jgi:hypothetical protein